MKAFKQKIINKFLDKVPIYYSSLLKNRMMSSSINS